MFDRDVVHLWILAAGLALLAVGFLIVRSAMIPPTFGDKGHYRAAADPELAARAPVIPARGECLHCHPRRKKADDESHQRVHCTKCHGLTRAAAHVADCRRARDAAKAAGKPTDKLKCDKKDLVPKDVVPICASCHTAVVGQPKGHPKWASVKDHLDDEEPDDPNKPSVCLDCHNPHTPAEEPDEVEDADDGSNDGGAAADSPSAATPTAAAPVAGDHERGDDKGGDDKGEQGEGDHEDEE